MTMRSVLRGWAPWILAFHVAGLVAEAASPIQNYKCRTFRDDEWGCPSSGPCSGTCYHTTFDVNVSLCKPQNGSSCTYSDTPTMVWYSLYTGSCQLKAGVFTYYCYCNWDPSSTPERGQVPSGCS